MTDPVTPAVLPPGLIHLGVSSDYKVWIAAFLTLAIFSFLYKDNPVFKLVEHLFAGVASAYVFCTQWHTVVKPNLVDPALSADTEPGERWLLLVPAFLCICMLTRIVPRWTWLSRWALAFIIGFYAGTNIPHYLETSVVKQLESCWERPLIVTVPADGEDAPEVTSDGAPEGTEPEPALERHTDWAASIENLIFITGVICVLTFFYFSLPHTGKAGRPLSVMSRVGRYFMMVAFGATFANTVMGRVSTLLGSLQLLLRDWLEIT